ncbi:TPA: hypothetical protein ACGRQV_005978 [Pseudomonas aeruginosa]|uniref:hypothetical protein n=1 Tax=Pseudomonas aeruginosa TaxID=287 RepID=UPI00106AAB8B|nr:hypothetical protein [Pseudomonas aeruginosa]MCG0257190.1 hypothetical protein [Pseudomonas aeruginosa]HBO4989135.1 hypothetical protein [Pseudomonas aeruginosa]HEH4313269.1 hypothetical protein [Pseudomonas aeruginosa]
MKDEDLPTILEPVIQALRCSISKQKAINNNLPLLESLRTYGYSHALIAGILSKESENGITPALLASMMYRARKRKTHMKGSKHLPAAPVDAPAASTGFRFGQGKVDPNAPIRRNTFEWDSVPKKSSTVKRNSAS